MLRTIDGFALSVDRAALLDERSFASSSSDRVKIDRDCVHSTLWRPLLPYMGTAIKHPVPDRVKPSFVIFDIRALWRSSLSVRVPGCQHFAPSSATLAESSRTDSVQTRRSGFQMLPWNGTDVPISRWTLPAQRPRGLDPTYMYDQRRRHHCLSAIHGCQPSAIELFRSPLLVPGTLCRAMSRPHYLCNFSLAVWRPTSSGVHYIDFYSAFELFEVA